jgi:two-component system LytT family response regulator
MSLKTLIVDDEPLARERLKLLLSHDAEVEIAAECRNGKEAIAYLKSKPADLLFLDIQMPGTGGFDVIDAIGLRHMPPTVFVTAYHEFAIKAFEVQAIDYLTKPIEQLRLQTAIARVKERMAANTALLTQEQLSKVLAALQEPSRTEQPYQERFLVRTGTKETFVPAQEIEWIEAQDYYSCLHVGNRKFMLRESIKQLSSKLDPSKFVRIHRSAIVNIDQVREIHREGRTECSAVLTNGQRLRMSKAGWQNLIASNRA